VVALLPSSKIGLAEGIALAERKGGTAISAKFEIEDGGSFVRGRSDVAECEGSRPPILEQRATPAQLSAPWPTRLRALGREQTRSVGDRARSRANRGIRAG
jgi:hypothetical protein